jgi:ATP-dependent Clp protease protease subunit
MLVQVIHRFYQRYTGLELDRIEEETDRDNFMSPKQAQELGIIDGIIFSTNLSAPAATTVAA